MLPVAHNAVGNDAASGHAITTLAGHPGAETAGRPAIGAVATVQLPDGRKLINMVDGGNGQSGVRSSDIHFGLGELEGDAKLTVELSWRDSDGQVRQESILISPGWHTVLLGS